MASDRRFEPRRLPGYSKADLIEEIRRVVDVLGGVVQNSTKFADVARVSLSQLLRQFGTYKDALVAAGFSYRSRGSGRGRKYTREQVLKNLREVLARADGYEFDLEFYRQHGGLLKSRQSVKNILGLKWKEALATVGAIARVRVQYITPHSQRLKMLANLTNDQLLAEIERVWRSLGRCPTANELRDNSNFLNNNGIRGVIQRRFGSFSKAIKALCDAKGLPYSQIPGASLKTVFDQEPRKLLVQDLKVVGAKLQNKSFTHKNYKSCGGTYSISTFQDHFGSWDAAVKEAGFASGKVREYSNDDLFNEMQRVWEQLGQQPTFDQMKAKAKINPATYHKRFGSWTKAIHAFCADRRGEGGEADARVVTSESLPVPKKPREDASSVVVEKTAHEKGASSSATPRKTIVALNQTPSDSFVLRKTGRQVPPRLRWNVFVRDNFSCTGCGRTPKEHGVTLEADHIRAYTNGGETVLENLQTLCSECNKGKSNQRH